MAKVTESTVESATLGWLESLGWGIRHGPEIAPDGLFAERQDYREVVLAQPCVVRSRECSFAAASGEGCGEVHYDGR